MRRERSSEKLWIVRVFGTCIGTLKIVSELKFAPRPCDGLNLAAADGTADEADAGV